MVRGVPASHVEPCVAEEDGSRHVCGVFCRHASHDGSTLPLLRTESWIEHTARSQSLWLEVWTYSWLVFRSTDKQLASNTDMTSLPSSRHCGCFVATGRLRQQDPDAVEGTT